MHAARANPPKPKQCKAPACKALFTPAKSMQVVCGWSCGAALAKSKREREAVAAKKAERKEDKARKDKLKRRQDWASEAERVVNLYVRLRDWRKGCVSCDKPPGWGGQWHASHFRSVSAASAVRFHLWNIHKACSQCNRNKGGNIIDYEPRLRALIGSERVDWLRTQNQRVTYSIEYLQRLKRVFAKKARRQAARNELAGAM